MKDYKGATAPVIRTESNRDALAREAENLAKSAIDSMMDSVPDHALAIERLCDAVLNLARIQRESGDG